MSSLLGRVHGEFAAVDARKNLSVSAGGIISPAVMSSITYSDE
jgi:hypothetical protein